MTAHAPTVTGHAPDVAAACSCGDYELGLPSRRAAFRWLDAHRAEAGIRLEVDTARGRGQAAELARRRAVIQLSLRHAAELAELEEAERVRLGLRPTTRQENRTA